MSKAIAAVLLVIGCADSSKHTEDLLVVYPDDSRSYGRDHGAGWLTRMDELVGVLRS